MSLGMGRGLEAFMGRTQMALGTNVRTMDI